MNQLKGKVNSKALLQKYGIILVMLVICILVSFMTDKFLSPSNIRSVARQVSINGALSIGMCFVILTGGIDLSVGSLLALTATVASLLGQSGMNWVLCVLIGSATGIFVGLLEGVLVARFKIAPFITTLAAMTICRGITQVADGGTSGRSPGNAFDTFFGTGSIGPIPMPVFIMILMFVIAWFILEKTKLGRHIYAVGGNEKAARLSGVSPKKIKIIVYMISGLCCSIAGYITCARLSSVTPTAGSGAEMDAIAACVLAGVRMDGGKGSIGLVVIGVFIIGILNNALNLIGVSSYWQDIVKGIVIVAAVLMEGITAHRSED